MTTKLVQNCYLSFIHQRWGFPMNYHREDDDEMVQEMVKCGGMTPAMAKDKALIAMVLPAIKVRPSVPLPLPHNRTAKPMHVTPLTPPPTHPSTNVQMDHLCMDKYKFDPTAEKVAAPIFAIGGDVDPRCPPEQLPEWDQYTSSTCEVQVFSGGHFFIKDKETELLSWISKTLTADTA